MEHTHHDNSGKHPKQSFQVERLAFFSDAVFAIAITLLVIEFKVPHITKDSTYQQVLLQLGELKSNVVALVLSYYMIAVYWMMHHFLYKYIHDYNRQIIVANLVALLPIIFLPFTTALFAECAGNKQTLMLGFQFFFANHFVAGLSIFALYWLAVIKHPHLSYEIPVPEKLKFYERTLFTSLILLSLFVTSLFTSNINTMLAVMIVCVLLRIFAMSILKKRFKAAAADLSIKK